MNHIDQEDPVYIMYRPWKYVAAETTSTEWSINLTDRMRLQLTSVLPQS